MKKKICFFVLSLGIVSIFFLTPAIAIVIDNGVSGDGCWEVDVLDAGNSEDGAIDPTGPTGLINVIYEFYTYADPGADGSAMNLDTNVTTPAFLSGSNEVTSEGNFAGPNGTINWTSVGSILPGSLIYNVTLSFTSSQPFGTVRVINYLDEDVLGSGDDVLVVFGTPGADDFQLLTVDQNNDVGVAQAAGYSSATWMTYIGWAADEFSDLRSAITGAGASYSIAGVIDTVDLPPYSDPRYPANDAYGPEDITTALAFDLDPTATSATVIFSLGGSPDA